MTAFGIQNKDGAISKFNTAEKAYQQTPFTGFRTIVKGSRGGYTFTHMPFFPNGFMAKEEKPVRNMMIGMNEMEIEETSKINGLKTNVLYFTVPEEEFPSLVRRTTFTNLDSSLPLVLDVLDGLGKLEPSGISNGNLDSIGRTMEAWMNVYNAASEGGITEPFFHISQGTGDTAQVQIIKDGHFSIAFIEQGEGLTMDPNGRHVPLPFIVDPSVVFDTDTTMTNPSNFFQDGAPDADTIAKLPQGTTSRTPCSFAAAKVIIAPGASVTITSVYGHAENLETFVGKYSPKIRSAGYVAKKRALASSLVNSITDKVASTTSSSLFDGYVKQDFLDNTLRGGMPISVGDPKDGKIYHVYSRIHGDLERDYNNFQFEASYFSQGPGNFRDVSQNRRLDVLLSPIVGDFNVRMFLSFVQADGYNPLTVATTNFKVPAVGVTALIAELGISDTRGKEVMNGLLLKSFRIGSLFSDMKQYGVSFTIDKDLFVTKVVTAAKQVFAGQFAQNGFWADVSLLESASKTRTYIYFTRYTTILTSNASQLTTPTYMPQQHWTYTLDLVQNYLAVFPDKEEFLLWESEPVPFFMSPAIVKSRADRYSLVPNPSKPGTQTIRVYSAVANVGEKGFPVERAMELQDIYADPNFVADPYGAGGVWQRSKDARTFTVSVIAKLSILGLLKFSTLDPMGMGVEMEGGKPGWNDAMNGLPGLVGSGMAETYEMLLILRYISSAVTRFKRGISYPAEFAEFLTGLDIALSVYSNSQKNKEDEFIFWEASNVAREKYRSDVVVTFSGLTVELPASYLIRILGEMEAKTSAGIERALATTDGLSPSYFYYECTNYGTKEIDTVTKVFCKEFSTHTLPQFLEGPIRHMKVIPTKDEREDVYQRTKASGMYDSALQMYKLSESLESMGQDVGRTKAFTPGWLENQSVWLHMSYKLYLELLRGGLYTEFYKEISTGLVPFMDNKVYGRSPLEAASFIVSSAFPDKKLHGASFLARLSGSTAEMMSMWAIMMAGQKPFSVDSNGGLLLSLQPVLPGWLFTEEGTVSFTFLGEVKVTYHNPSKEDSWTMSPKSSIVVYKDQTSTTFAEGIIRGKVAESVRSLNVATIDIYY